MLDLDGTLPAQSLSSAMPSAKTDWGSACDAECHLSSTSTPALVASAFREMAVGPDRNDRSSMHRQCSNVSLLHEQPQP
jgi:hypothetical protein